MPLPPTTPDLEALDLFVSVVETGSLSKAASVHGIAQPSASSRIAYLEKQLGLSLLDRSPTGSTPTVAGRVVAGWAEGVLRSASDLNAGVRALKARKVGRLRVAASMTIAEYLLPAWLEKFLRNRPDDSVKLEVTNSATVLRLLSSREISLGFIESPDDLAAMCQQIIATDRLVVTVSPGHPWVARAPISVEELAATPLIVREQGSGTRQAFERALAEYGFEPPSSALVLGSTAAVRSAVISGQSPTVISERAIDTHLAAGSLVEIDIDGLAINRELRAVWVSDSPLPSVAEDLLATLPNLPTR